MVTKARTALALGVVGLVVWPLSYAWIPSAGGNPAWIELMVPIAEWGAIGCAVAAIWLGTLERRSQSASTGATWAPRVGWLTLGLMTISFIVISSLYRAT